MWGTLTSSMLSSMNNINKTILESNNMIIQKLNSNNNLLRGVIEQINNTNERMDVLLEAQVINLQSMIISLIVVKKLEILMMQLEIWKLKLM